MMTGQSKDFLSNELGTARSHYYSVSIIITNAVLLDKILMGYRSQNNQYKLIYLRKPDLFRKT